MTKENATSIHIKDFQGVKIHSFVAPYEYAANATHIIETANELVIVDGQFITPLALAFRGYVDSLNKPINRVFRFPWQWCQTKLSRHDHAKVCGAEGGRGLGLFRFPNGGSTNSTKK